MTVPFVLDNIVLRTATALRQLLDECESGPIDIASAYFSVSGYRLLKDELDAAGAMRLLLGHEPTEGQHVGVRPRLVETMAGELEGMALDEPTMRLVEDLIAFLRQDKAEVRLYERAFLHAKAYIFHRDQVSAKNRHDRLQPFAAVVGSSNFTGPGLTSNRELNLVHRVFTEEDPATDKEAAARTAYLRDLRLSKPGEALFETVDVPREELPTTNLFDDKVSPAERRLIKSEVGARAVMEVEAWFQRHWEEAVDFKEDLIDLLNRSKFGQYEYSPYQIYLKALYEYLRDQMDADDQMLMGRTAVDLAEFQEDSVKRARRILRRYDGVLVADSVGLGKTWIGKRLLEDFAYHRRQKAVVVCPASLRNMWKRELEASTIAASVVGMEELGRDTFDLAPYADADVVLVDEAHNFRNDKSNRYLALDDLIQRNRGRGRDGERKKVILLSATPINNDLGDLHAQIRLFTQGEEDYFQEAGIGDLTRYFRAARRAARQTDRAPGELLFNLLDEFVVRNTRPYIRAAYPNATVGGEAIHFPERRLDTIEYSLLSVWGGEGLYRHIVDQIDALSLAPYGLEAYRSDLPVGSGDDMERGRQAGLIGIFKTRFLKRLESSIEAFRLSVHRAIVFETVYLEFLNQGRVIASRDFWKMLRIAEVGGEDDLDADEVAEGLLTDDQVREYLGTLPSVDLSNYDVDGLRAAVEADLAILRDLSVRIEPLQTQDKKLERLKELLAGELRGRKILIFTSFKDTARYLGRELQDDAWLQHAGRPHVRRIDSGNHPGERTGIVAAFAPRAMEGTASPTDEQIDILVSTDVLSEGQNLQDCGVMINYDLTWNPIRLVQRSGRIDRLRSPHKHIEIWNMFPERELEELLRLVERLTSRIGQIDDLGMLDASVLGEMVHPRTFNALRRVRDGDVTVLDEEEARAELAGPEMLLTQLRAMLNRQGAEEAINLPDGIHSGLRRERCNGMFYYFKAERPGGGFRHFWRYIDAASGAVTDNRFEIAQMIACQQDEPRYIGSQDLYKLQEAVIGHIVGQTASTATRAVLSVANDPIQQTIAEDLKRSLRAGSVDRQRTKVALAFLAQPVGKALVHRLKEARKDWLTHQSASQLLSVIESLAEDYGKADGRDVAAPLCREDLHLVCFEFVSA